MLWVLVLCFISLFLCFQGQMFVVMAFSEVVMCGPSEQGKPESEAKVPITQTYPAYLCHFPSEKFMSTRMQLLNSHSSNKYLQVSCVPGTTLDARTW